MNVLLPIFAWLYISVCCHHQQRNMQCFRLLQNFKCFKSSCHLLQSTTSTKNAKYLLHSVMYICCPFVSMLYVCVMCCQVHSDVWSSKFARYLRTGFTNSISQCPRRDLNSNEIDRAIQTELVQRPSLCFKHTLAGPLNSVWFLLTHGLNAKGACQ